MPFLIVDGVRVHVRMGNRTKPLSQADRQAISDYARELNRRAARALHEPGCRILIGGSECSCSKEYRHATYGDAEVTLKEDPSDG